MPRLSLDQQVERSAGIAWWFFCSIQEENNCGVYPRVTSVMDLQPVDEVISSGKGTPFFAPIIL
ncbi:hypothetical protein LJC37_05740 [Bacteroidales bacterium OttesenSCG-928-E04]|nr:hypothetical protein [Bacteroidales bacterium OttesenSCG-928-E04]MDL2326648.1 hypothetical protein [Bacteroidales bacterium OttesenSCG-928-A14]